MHRNLLYIQIQSTYELLVCLVVSKSLRVWNVKHLEEKSSVRDVVRVVVVVDSEPHHGVRLWFQVSYNTAGSSRGDQNWRCVGSGSLGWNQTQIVVPIDIGFFKFVQIINGVQAEFVHILLDFGRQEIGKFSLVRSAFTVGGNQVVRFSNTKNLAQTKRHFLLVLLITCHCSYCYGLV